jgi:hypothetical protein
VRKHISAASAILALALGAAACGSSSAPSASGTPTPACVNASAPHHAYVVVEHMSGKSLQRCVGFTGDTLGGQALMDQSGISYQTQTFSFGKAACAVDNEPATFTQCLPANAPYWALFVETGGTWASAQTGYTDITLHDKDALGWHYVQASDATPAPPPLADES